MDIGRRVREVREDLGMQRTVLARRVGVAENTIYRIETGKRTPSVEVLEKIARELRTEPAEFLREPVPLAEASETRFPDPDELYNVSELLYWQDKAFSMRKPLEAYDRILSMAPDEQKRLAGLNILISRYAERIRKLAPPLARIERRLLEPDPSKPFREKVRIVFLRPPTPEERAKLEAKYPDAEVVEADEAEDTDLVEAELVHQA
jgi:transcriptional regulator with XRE-family HTH domain